MRRKRFTTRHSGILAAPTLSYMGGNYVHSLDGESVVATNHRRRQCQHTTADVHTLASHQFCHCIIKMQCYISNESKTFTLSFRACQRVGATFNNNCNSLYYVHLLCCVVKEIVLNTRLKTATPLVLSYIVLL